MLNKIYNWIVSGGKTGIYFVVHRTTERIYNTSIVINSMEGFYSITEAIKVTISKKLNIPKEDFIITFFKKI